MVGDRAADVVAARVHGVRAVAAGCGYGSRDELERAVTHYVAETVHKLIPWLDQALVMVAPARDRD
jgi:phosphoglycolate phosphatase-like HAD superfamily hydrolase